MNVQTYLFFDNCCDKAIELYDKALGADLLHVTRFTEAPAFLRSPDRDHLVFHATLRIGETLISMSDDPTKEHVEFGGFALLVHLDSADAVDSAMSVLATDGQVVMEAQATFWAERYGIVTDPFGVKWKLQFSA